jgi:DNA-binding CsgD family transcriptional regulator
MGKSPPETSVRRVEPMTSPGPSEVPCLEVLSGASAGRVVPIRLPVLTIGRDPTSNIVLGDEGVSRNHVKIIMYDDGRPNVVDLESTNGTFINGKQVDVAPLSEGDRIQLGPEVILRLSYWGEAQIEKIMAGTPDEPDPEPLPLSQRELEIAELVVEGLTNADIGQELGISLRTVTTHIANIYRRLDIHSRAALTRLFMERRGRRV